MKKPKQKKKKIINTKKLDVYTCGILVIMKYYIITWPIDRRHKTRYFFKTIYTFRLLSYGRVPTVKQTIFEGRLIILK